MAERRTFTAGKLDAGERLDVWLTGFGVAPSRASVQKLIADGYVLVDGQAGRASHRLRPGERVEVEIPDPAASCLIPEDIPLDVLYEDDDVLVINKPKGLVVHPAAGNPRGTLVNALLARSGSLSGVGGEVRPGIVHRLDKDTSGVMVVAKNDRAHLELSRQIKERSAGRVYLALVHGIVQEDRGMVDAPVGRHPVQRYRMAVVAEGRPAVTRYRVLERFPGEDLTLLECRLETGRTHQIRVHMSHIGHPVVGDPLYGPRHCPYGLQGQALHARRLSFTHPRSGRPLEFLAPLPGEFRRLLARLRAQAAPPAAGGEGPQGPSLTTGEARSYDEEEVIGTQSK